MIEAECVLSLASGDKTIEKSFQNERDANEWVLQMGLSKNFSHGGTNNFGFANAGEKSRVVVVFSGACIMIIIIGEYLW